MAGSTRTSADPHDEAYQRGLDGKPLSPRLLRLAETDDSILDSWREGKADRPGDQPDSEEESEPESKEESEPEPKAKEEPEPKPAPHSRPKAPARSSRSSRSSTGRGRRTSRPTVTNPTGGRLPIGLSGDGVAGLFFGAIAYALVLSVADYGVQGPLYWFKAKFLNQPAPAKSK